MTQSFLFKEATSLLLASSPICFPPKMPIISSRFCSGHLTSCGIIACHIRKAYGTSCRICLTSRHHRQGFHPRARCSHWTTTSAQLKVPLYRNGDGPQRMKSIFADMLQSPRFSSPSISSTGLVGLGFGCPTSFKAATTISTMEIEKHHLGASLRLFYVSM